MNDQQIRVLRGGRMVPPTIPFGMAGFIIALVIFAIVLFNCYFTVQPEEVGLIVTFGKYTRTAEPGLNFKVPFVQQVILVPVQRQLKQEFGFRTQRSDIRSTFTSEGLEDESLLLTGDLNVALVEWIAQYRVIDPYKFTFRVRNVEETFRDMNEAVMRSVVGDRSVSEVLTIGRQEIASEVERRLQELCDQYETGIHVEQIVLQDVTPPDEVKPSFNEVNQAQQERERLINEARAEFNKVVPKARGEAQQMIQEAEGYATDRVNRSEGDAALFDSLLAAYRRAPDVTRRRMYLETMQKIMPRVQQKVILDKDMKGILPLLSIGKGAVEVKP